MTQEWGHLENIEQIVLINRWHTMEKLRIKAQQLLVMFPRPKTHEFIQPTEIGVVLSWYLFRQEKITTALQNIASWKQPDKIFFRSFPFCYCCQARSDKPRILNPWIAKDWKAAYNHAVSYGSLEFWIIMAFPRSKLGVLGNIHYKQSPNNADLTSVDAISSGMYVVNPS